MERKPMKVLLIDDDRECLESLGGCLEIEGYETLQFVDPALAIESYVPGSVDAIVTDINMPKISGIQVLQRIKSLDPDAYVIMLTGYADVENSISSLNNGAYTLLRKPLRIRDLLATLGEVRDKRREHSKLKKKVQEFDRTTEDLDKTYEELQNHVVAVDQVQSVISKIHAAIDLPYILNEMVAHVSHLLGCNSSMITVLDGDRRYCKCYARGKSSAGLRCSVAAECMDCAPISSWPSSGSTWLDNDPGEDTRRALRQHGIEASNMIVAPLMHGEKSLGTLVGFNKSGGFCGNDKFMLTMVSSIAVTAIFNNGLISQLKELFETTIESLAKTIDAKDSYTSGHTGRVSQYTLAIGRELGWSEEKLNQAYIGTLFHDIGKIGIPDHVLNKKGKLTNEEYELMKGHVTIGYEILKDIPKLKDVLDYVLCHHERWDGRGYPRGLADEQIPLEGRVVCVADSFDAMISNRSYRNALPVAKALDELKRGAGSQFDSRIVEVFIGLLRSGKLEGISATPLELDVTVKQRKQAG
jgi:response regulator RpfG family c-di-GMP phosphodiesterase